MTVPPDANPREIMVGSADSLTEIRTGSVHELVRHARVLRVSPWALGAGALLAGSDGRLWEFLARALETLLDAS